MWRCHLKSFLCNLAVPNKLSKVPIAELMKPAAAHYHPKPSLAVRRFRFNSRMLQAKESVAAYLAELKRLSEHCSFGDTLNDMLRDRIVCGIQDQRKQRKLLVEPDLTLRKAFKVTQAIESADTQVKELQHPPARQKCAPLAPSSDCFERHDGMAVSSMAVHQHQLQRLIATHCSFVHRILYPSVDRSLVVHPFSTHRSAAAFPTATEPMAKMRTNALGITM